MSNWLVALASAVVLVALLGFVSYGADQMLHDADTRLIALQAERAAIRARLAEAATTLDFATRTEQRLQAIAEQGDQAILVAAQQERARAALSAAGGQLLSVQSSITDLSDSYTKSTITLRARGSEATLMSFLRSLDAATARIAVEALDVQQLPAGEDLQQLDIAITLVAIVDASPAP